MTRDEYLRFHREACDKMIAITRAKNHDYCGSDGNPFSNFTRVEALGITDAPRGFLVRMTDKFARITSFVQKGVLEVKDESVEDTLLDLANYSLLLAGYIRSQRQAALPLQPRMFTDTDATKILEPKRMATQEEMAALTTANRAYVSDASTRAANTRAP